METAERVEGEIATFQSAQYGPTVTATAGFRSGSARLGAFLLGSHWRVLDGAQSLPIAYELHKWAAILSLLGQIAIVVTQYRKGNSLAAMAAPVGVAATVAMLAAWILLRPWQFWGNRFWMMPAMRVALFLVPSFRHTGVGSSLVLEQLPRPGLAGATTDLARVIFGTRLLGLSVPAFVLTMSPTATLATQLVLAALVHTSSYCSTPLLAAPLTGHRIMLAASHLELLALPVALGLPPAFGALIMTPAVAQSTAPAHEVCHATLSFLHLTVGVVLPTLVALISCQQPLAASEYAAPESAARGASRWLARLCCSAQQHIFTIDRAAIKHFGRNALPIPQAAVLLWCILVLLWQGCKLATGLL